MSAGRLAKFGFLLPKVEPGRAYPQAFMGLLGKFKELETLYKGWRQEFEAASRNELWSAEGKAKKLAEIQKTYHEKLAALEHQAGLIDGAIEEAKRKIDATLRADVDPGKLGILQTAFMQRDQSEQTRIVMESIQRGDRETLAAVFSLPPWTLGNPELVQRFRGQASAALAPKESEDLEALRAAKAGWDHGVSEVRQAFATIAPEGAAAGA